MQVFLVAVHGADPVSLSVRSHQSTVGTQPPTPPPPHPPHTENVLAPAGCEDEGSFEAADEDPSTTQFYLLDFGGASRMTLAAAAGSGEATSAHQQPSAAALAYSSSLWCTPGYASVSALRGGRPCPADDAESLCCVMLWLATGQLPW